MNQSDPHFTSQVQAGPKRISPVHITT